MSLGSIMIVGRTFLRAPPPLPGEAAQQLPNPGTSQQPFPPSPLRPPFDERILQEVDGEVGVNQKLCSNQ